MNLYKFHDHKSNKHAKNVIKEMFSSVAFAYMSFIFL